MDPRPSLYILILLMVAYCYILIYTLNKRMASHCLHSQDLLIFTVPNVLT